MENLCGIYGIFEKETGRCLYVGQSANIKNRFQKHKYKLNKGIHLKNFSKWFNDSGKNIASIEFKILEECSNENELKNTLEIKWFKFLKPMFYGVEPSVNSKWQHSSATKEKISKTIQSKVSSRLNEEFNCLFCGKKYNPSHYNGQKYCSIACGVKARRSLNPEEIKILYNSGLSLKEIGLKFKVSYRTIHQIMVENNIPRRNNKNGLIV